MNKGKACRDENGKFITGEQAMRRYNMSRGVIMKLAKEADALIKFGKTVRYNSEKIDAFLDQNYSMK